MKWKTFFALSIGFALVGLMNANTEASDIDVRVIVDISGSMKKNDPQNLRAPTIRLFADLLPDNAKAGVWTFGKYVNMLVPHQTIDSSWRQKAKASSDSIHSIAMWTHIPRALETAANSWQHAPPSEQRTLILLTDGLIDISPDPQKNASARLYLLEKVLPSIQASGAKIYSIAMSDNVDHDLLAHLAEATQGVYVKANNKDDLLPIFTQIFDKAVPQQQVPLIGNTFEIDPGVTEFTALIFHNDPTPITLISPSKTQFTGSQTNIRWAKEPHFDLITLANPETGRWQLSGELGANSRVTIVSDLKLQVEQLDGKSLPHQLALDHFFKLRAYLTEQDSILLEPNFLSIMDINIHHEHRLKDGTLYYEQNKIITSHTDNKISIPKGGIYQYNTPTPLSPGQHTFTIQVNGKTFRRLLKHSLQVVEPMLEDSPLNNASITEPEVSLITPPLEDLINEERLTQKAPSTDNSQAEDDLETLKNQKLPTIYWLYVLAGFIGNILILIFGRLIYKNAAQRRQSEFDSLSILGLAT